jgi:hypothetical protein
MEYRTDRRPDGYEIDEYCIMDAKHRLPAYCAAANRALIGVLKKNSCLKTLRVCGTPGFEAALVL